LDFLLQPFFSAPKRLFITDSCRDIAVIREDPLSGIQFKEAKCRNRPKAVIERDLFEGLP
jgi:hypothetical protein